MFNQSANLTLEYHKGIINCYLYLILTSHGFLFIFSLYCYHLNNIAFSLVKAMLSVPN